MRSLVAAVALLAFAPGCDDPASGEDLSWQQSDDPVPTTGLPYAVGSTVHLSGGSIDTSATVAAFVVAGDGTYFVADDDPEDGDRPSRGTQRLRFASKDGDVLDTGVDVLVETLRASPDGRHLAAVDMESGEEDDHGTPQAALVVWDLRTGREVIRSTDATGDPDKDDLAALYPELEMRIASIDDDGLRLDAVGTWSYDFATGAAERLADDAEPETPTSALVSPGGKWRIDRAGQDQLLLGPAGRRVVPGADPRRVELYGWLDDDTAYGVLDGPPASVTTCEVPSGACTEIPGTAGEYVVLPNQLGTTGLDLTEGGG